MLKASKCNIELLETSRPLANLLPMESRQIILRFQDWATTAVKAYVQQWQPLSAKLLQVSAHYSKQVEYSKMKDTSL